MSTPADTIPDVLVLAAVDRAERHRGRDTPGVPIWDVMDHLNTPRRSGRGRYVRARLDALEAAGLLERGRRHSVTEWALSTAGRERLSRASRAGELPELPESPQHVAWREARAAAQAGIAEFIRGVGEAMTQTYFLLKGARVGTVSSDAWFGMAERLQRECRRLGTATYCLYEWNEPEDEWADIDTRDDPSDLEFPEEDRKRRRARRAGRRNLRRGLDDPAR